MKIKKGRKNYLLVIAIILIIGGAFLLIRGLSGEDSWIKDSKGIYVKHGNPSETPDYVLQQEEMIECAYEKFDSLNEKNSQCLGICGDYAVDLVSVPITAEDNLFENQCEQYRSGEVSHFIELNNQKGEIVRIV